MKLSSTLIAVAAGSFISLASAQSDSCTTATAIAGQGNFPYNNATASTGTEGQTETLCYDFGSSAIDNDMWFSWTADATGPATITTCNNTATDTKIGAYPGGGCPTVGSALDCNDDTCGLQSQISFPVVSGTAYMVQVGNFPGSAGGTSAIDIVIGGPPTGNDDCAAALAIAGQGNFPYDSSSASTGIEGQGETLCYDFGTSGIDNDMWFSWTADATGPATVSMCNGTAIDTKIASYPGGGCPTSGSALACNDDTCGLQSEINFNVVSGTSYMLQIGNFPGVSGGIGSFDISIQGPAEPGTGFCFCDSGNSPCGNGGAAGNGCANGSNANGANLTASGSASVGADTMVLSASGLAPGQPGLYFQGDNQVNGGAGIVFGDGIRCAGTNVIRLGVANADAAGNSDTSGLGVAISVKGGVVLGDNRSYQLWYRDPAGSPCGALFNLSNGYNVQW
jgi:hypothetical protein